MRLKTGDIFAVAVIVLRDDIRADLSKLIIFAGNQENGDRSHLIKCCRCR